MPVILTNNATSLLAGNITQTATTISVTASDAGKFPTPTDREWFPVTLVDGAGNTEIMRATKRVGAVITVVRAQEGTTAKAFTAGARIDVRITSDVFKEMVKVFYDMETLLNGDDAAWHFQPIGVPIPFFANLNGANLPPKDKRYRYILLSAGQTAEGGYNNGVLTGEKLTGSAPSLLATAKIALAGSPMNGETINLLNTSNLFLRAGTSNAIEESQNLNHTHTGSTASAGAHTHTSTAGNAGDHTHGASTNSTGNHSHGLTVGDRGGGGQTSEIYREDAGRTTDYGSKISSGGQHSHSVTINSSGSHSHTISVASAGAHTHTVTNMNEGGAEARPRNLNVQYIMRVM